MLKLTLAHRGEQSKLELDGVDVSRFFRSLTIRAEVGETTYAVLEYSGAIVVDGDAGTVTLTKHDGDTAVLRAMHVQPGRMQ